MRPLPQFGRHFSPALCVVLLQVLFVDVFVTRCKFEVIAGVVAGARQAELKKDGIKSEGTKMASQGAHFIAQQPRPRAAPTCERDL